jgi:hypothetical protein
LWKGLPPSYRYNCASLRYEAVFQDADCSSESFEGIRAQDILPLLKQNFDPRLCIGFGNIIDPFIDRSFGPNFDPSAAWDREFIDSIHRRDELEMAAGRLQPTHLIAMLAPLPVGASLTATNPAKSDDGEARFPREMKMHTQSLPAANSETSGYEWKSWPHAADWQLQRVCEIVENAENRITCLQAELSTVIADARQLRSEFEERTAWALRLDEELRRVISFHQNQEEEILNLALWGRKLDAELYESNLQSVRREAALEARTAQALQLRAELSECTVRIGLLERELAVHTTYRERLNRRLGWLRFPFKLLERLLGRARENESEATTS